MALSQFIVAGKYNTSDFMYSFLLLLVRLPYILILVLGFKLLQLIGLNPNICKLLRHLGPSFIKLGQTLSVRPDIVGEEVSIQLRQLQDSMPAFSSSRATRIIEKSFLKPIDELFDSFYFKPIAAASIAQVHKAQLKDGTWVAIKVLRPGIGKRFKRDIHLFYILAHLFW